MPLEKSKTKTATNKTDQESHMYRIGLLCIKYTRSAWVFYISLNAFALATNEGLPCL